MTGAVAHATSSSRPSITGATVARTARASLTTRALGTESGRSVASRPFTGACATSRSGYVAARVARRGKMRMRWMLGAEDKTGGPCLLHTRAVACPFQLFIRILSGGVLSST